MKLQTHYYDANNLTSVYCSVEVKNNSGTLSYAMIGWRMDKETKNIEVVMQFEFADGSDKIIFVDEKQFTFIDTFFIEYKNILKFPRFE